MNWLRGTDFKEYCRKIVINEQRSCIFKPAYCYNLSRTVRVGLALKLRFLSNGPAGQSKQYTPHRDLNQYRKCVGVAEVVSSWHYTQDDWIVLVIDWCLKRAWCRQYSPINVSNLLPATICSKRQNRNRSSTVLIPCSCIEAFRPLCPLHSYVAFNFGHRNLSICHFSCGQCSFLQTLITRMHKHKSL